jgi:chromosome segregation ATPase
MNVMDDRERVNRWLDEGQYLLGRLLPAFLDDRERLKRYVEIAEWDRDRLKLEVEELRREISSLEARYRTEQVAVASAFADVNDLVGRLQKPLGDIAKRILPAQVLTPDEATR